MTAHEWAKGLLPLAGLLVIAFGICYTFYTTISSYSYESIQKHKMLAEKYSSACIKSGGQPVDNGKHLECLK